MLNFIEFLRVVFVQSDLPPRSHVDALRFLRIARLEFVNMFVNNFRLLTDDMMVIADGDEEAIVNYISQNIEEEGVGSDGESEQNSEEDEESEEETDIQLDLHDTIW